MKHLKGRVLSIAGSDSGGGAGIQADIKAICAMGAYAATAVTAITVQNTQGVSAIQEVPLEIIEGQIRAVLEDIGADAIKTGMLHSAEVIGSVAEMLAELAPDIPLILDPVMVATSGDRLLEQDAVDTLKRELIPHAALLTPNLGEAEILTGTVIASLDDMEVAASALLALGPKAVLLKGGHLAADESGQVHDLLAVDGALHWFTHARIDTRHTHGTGCTLASAIAAGLAQGRTLNDAVTRARAYVHLAIETAPGLGRGHGPLNHCHGVLPGNS